MELRQLEHFVAVAEEGHFTRAAGHPHISQSALSTSIRSPERRVTFEVNDVSTILDFVAHGLG